MEVVELKFLLTLLGYPPDYRAPLSALRPTGKLPDRNRACRQLCDRGLIDVSKSILRFKLAPPGKALLKLDPAQLPISDEELLILKASAAGTVTPGQALPGIPANERQVILEGLDERGLILAETQIKDVWITQAGQTYLHYEYLPKGNPTLSLNLVANYIAFLRRASAQTDQSDLSPMQDLRWKKSAKPTDAEIIQLIRTLDHELGTENYLPLFHLRQALQPPLSRDELDQALYRLQRRDEIELGALQEAIAYTREQVEAGIPQDIGGSLFFISIMD